MRASKQAITGNEQSIGVIAGGGQFPLLFIEAAQKAGRKVVVVAHKGETDERVAKAADIVCWLKLGQFGKLISFLQMHGVTETVFLGTQSHRTRKNLKEQASWSLSTFI